MNPVDEFHKLAAAFPSDEPLVENVEYIPAQSTPEPYKGLLVHTSHMTVTMERFHGCSVDVHVLDRRLDGDLYSRKILLTRHGTDEVVQFGFVQFDFSTVSEEVRQEILSEQIPLGRVLINHNVMRQVDLNAILRLTAGPGLAKALQIPVGAVTYGRIATIFCNDQPAIDLLEVSTVLPEQPAAGR